MKMRTLLLVGILSLFFEAEVCAQSQPRKYELGAHFVGLGAHGTRFPDRFKGEVTNQIDDFVDGVGMRAGYNLFENLAVEAEINVFRRPPTDDPATLGKWSQGLFGLKLSKRLSSIRVFAKLRPGFTRFDGVTTAIERLDGSADVFLIKDNTFFAVDVGGGVELYPSPRTIIRLDAGDAIIRYTGRPGKGFDPVSNVVRRNYYGHNVQFSLGFAVRF